MLQNRMTLDERVAALEGRMHEQSVTLEFFRDAIARIERRFTAVDERFTALEQHMDARFAQVDARFAQVDARFAQVDARFDRLEDKMSRQFLWIVGIQVTVLIAVVAALIGVVGVVVTRT